MRINPSSSQIIDHIHPPALTDSERSFDTQGISCKGLKVHNPPIDEMHIEPGSRLGSLREVQHRMRTHPISTMASTDGIREQFPGTAEVKQVRSCSAENSLSAPIGIVKVSST